MRGSPRVRTDGPTPVGCPRLKRPGGLTSSPHADRKLRERTRSLRLDDDVIDGVHRVPGLVVDRATGAPDASVDELLNREDFRGAPWI